MQQWTLLKVDVAVFEKPLQSFWCVFYFHELYHGKSAI